MKETISGAIFKQKTASSDPIICVFDHQQHRTVHVRQTPVQGLQAGPVSHSAVDQPPGVALHAGRQAGGELRAGRQRQRQRQRGP